MAVKNVVFDVGNVLVRWAPEEVTAKVFPGAPADLHLKLFKSPIWYDLNLGKLTEAAAIQQYHRELGLPLPQVEAVMQEVKDSLVPMEGSFELVEELYHAGVPLYSITDNIREIMTYLRNRYTFWERFQGVVVSADINVLKPAPAIYRHLLETYSLRPEESIFIDDLQRNVEGACQVGMQGIQFTTATECRVALKAIGVRFP